LRQLNAESIDRQAAEIANEAGRLLVVEGLRPADLVVLVAGKPKQDFYDSLARHRMPGKRAWSIEVRSEAETVLVDTVARFKGLEAPVIFLWLPPIVDEVDDKETLYVGLTRAKSRVYLVGRERICSWVAKGA
jgi:superfamily I DNA/RNA helicase